MSKDSKILPLTFRTLPWVAGIDTLSDLEWLRSNPDGHLLLRTLVLAGLVSGQHRAMLDAIAKPLRNLAGLMLRDEGRDKEYPGMLDILGILDDAPVWKLEGKHFEEILRNDLDGLKQHFPALPLTFQLFLDHMRADAEYFLAKASQEQLEDAYKEARLHENH